MARNREAYHEYFVEEELEAGLGEIYPMPGGLKENVKWLLGEDILARQVEGEKRLYRICAIRRCFL